MSSKKSLRRNMPPSSKNFRQQYDSDPNDLSRRRTLGRKAGRKTLQLCSEVQDTLNYLLSGECADEVLALFQVAEVRPAPDATQLLVVVFPAVQLSEELKPGELLDRLAAASGRLRAGVAAAITRKRAPKLLFQIAALPAGEGWR